LQIPIVKHFSIKQNNLKVPQCVHSTPLLPTRKHQELSPLPSTAMKVPTLLCTLRRTTSHWRRDNPCCIWVDAPLLSHCRLATLSSTIACYRDRRPFSSCPALEDHDSTTTAALAHLISGEPIHTQRQLREMFEALTIRDRRKWSIIANGRGLERSFRFKTFKSAWVSLLSPLLHPYKSLDTPVLISLNY